MGYAHYVLPDGREAGYGVKATCDMDGCEQTIDRGLGYLCGHNPLGHKDAEEFGCGNYYCSAHGADHDCPDAVCGQWDSDEDNCCDLHHDHESDHYDRASETRWPKADLAAEAGDS